MEISRVTKAFYWVGFMGLILIEASRKYFLWNAGIPWFVLTNEPLFSANAYGYGLIVSGLALFGVICFSAVALQESSHVRIPRWHKYYIPSKLLKWLEISIRELLWYTGIVVVLLCAIGFIGDLFRGIWKPISELGIIYLSSEYEVRSNSDGYVTVKTQLWEYYCFSKNVHDICFPTSQKNAKDILLNLIQRFKEE